MHMCNKSKWLTKQLNYCKCKIKSVRSSKIVFNLPEQFVQPKPKLFRQSAVLVGKCPMSDHYFKHCMWVTSGLFCESVGQVGQQV